MFPLYISVLTPCSVGNLKYPMVPSPTFHVMLCALLVKSGQPQNIISRVFIPFQYAFLILCSAKVCRDGFGARKGRAARIYSARSKTTRRV